MRLSLVALSLTLVALPARADDGATARHLLAGVRAFRDNRYEEALVELQVVARAPDAPDDLAFYLGPTYYKLGRYEDALETFATSKATPDPLTDFYRGETCYQLKLYRKARAIFADLRAQNLGPVLDDAAARYVAEVDAVYKQPPSDATIDYYADLGNARLAARKTAIAGEVLDEARQVEALATDRHRHAEILAALGAAWNATGHARAVVDALGSSPDPGVQWELARAYVALGDAAHAHPILDGLVAAHAAHAADATALLRTLP